MGIQQTRAITDLISNIGTTSANIMKSKRARQVAELRFIQEKNAKEELAIYEMQEEVKKNLKDSGLQSDSFYQMAYGNISDLSIYNTRREQAFGSEARRKATEEYALAAERDKQTKFYINFYKGWLETYGKEISENAKNQPGGVFTGINTPMPNGHFNDFSKEAGLQYRLKNALVGVQLNNEGTALLPTVKYYQKKDGTIMGRLPGYDDFDVMTTISKEPIMIQNFQKTLGSEFEKLGIKKDGVIKDEYLDFLKATEASTFLKQESGDDLEVTTRKIPVNVATSNRWLQKVEEIFQGQLRAVTDKSDFNNMQATYMSIAGAMDVNNDGVISAGEFKQEKVQTAKNNFRNVNVNEMTSQQSQIIKPLTYKNGSFQLDEESEQRLRAVFLDNAYSDFMGPGYVQQMDIPETIAQGKTRRRRRDDEQKKVASAVTKGKNQGKSEAMKNAISFSKINPKEFGFSVNDFIKLGEVKPTKRNVLEEDIKIPSKQTDRKNYNEFVKVMSAQGFNVTALNDIEKGEQKTTIASKGNKTNAPKKFVISSSSKIKGKSFYRDIFLMMGIQQSAVDELVKELFSTKKPLPIRKK